MLRFRKPYQSDNLNLNLFDNLQRLYRTFTFNIYTYTCSKIIPLLLLMPKSGKVAFNNSFTRKNKRNKFLPGFHPLQIKYFSRKRNSKRIFVIFVIYFSVSVLKITTSQGSLTIVTAFLTVEKLCHYDGHYGGHHLDVMVTMIANT